MIGEVDFDIFSKDRFERFFDGEVVFLTQPVGNKFVRHTDNRQIVLEIFEMCL
jgi:hypothetical protein